MNPNRLRSIDRQVYYAFSILAVAGLGLAACSPISESQIVEVYPGSGLEIRYSTIQNEGQEKFVQASLTGASVDLLQGGTINIGDVVNGYIATGHEVVDPLACAQAIADYQPNQAVLTHPGLLSSNLNHPRQFISIPVSNPGCSEVHTRVNPRQASTEPTFIPKPPESVEEVPSWIIVLTSLGVLGGIVGLAIGQQIIKLKAAATRNRQREDQAKIQAAKAAIVEEPEVATTTVSTPAIWNVIPQEITRDENDQITHFLQPIAPYLPVGSLDLQRALTQQYVAEQFGGLEGVDPELLTQTLKAVAAEFDPSRFAPDTLIRAVAVHSTVSKDGRPDSGPLERIEIQTSGPKTTILDLDEQFPPEDQPIYN